jgi:hypothetical protein
MRWRAARRACVAAAASGGVEASGESFIRCIVGWLRCADVRGRPTAVAGKQADDLSGFAGHPLPCARDEAGDVRMNLRGMLRRIVCALVAMSSKNR